MNILYEECLLLLCHESSIIKDYYWNSNGNYRGDK